MWEQFVGAVGKGISAGVDGYVEKKLNKNQPDNGAAKVAAPPEMPMAQKVMIGAGVLIGVVVLIKLVK